MRKALLLSIIFILGSSAVVFSQETGPSENTATNSKVLEKKIAAMQAELSALRQQLAIEAESRQEEVPPPPPTPARSVAPYYDYSQSRPEYQPTTVVERPVYVQVPTAIQPVYQTPVYQTPSPYYQTPYYCPNSYGYGYGGVGAGLSVGGVNVGFYPSIGFGFGF